MELNFLLLVTAALVGLVINAIWKFNPWAIFGSLGFVVLVLPMLRLAFVQDPQAAQLIANDIIENLINALPSTIIGELAGIVAATIFNTLARAFR